MGWAKAWVKSQGNAATQKRHEGGDEIKHHCRLRMTFLLRLIKHSAERPGSLQASEPREGKQREMGGGMELC